MDFEIKVWGEDDLPNLELVNSEVILDTQLNPALRSDFMRLELLFKFGGIYADVDMTCERPLTPLLRTNFDFITGLSNTLAFECNNGLILSKPACPFVSTLISDLRVSFLKEKELLKQRIAKEKPVLQVLKMVDPSKAEQLQNS